MTQKTAHFSKHHSDATAQDQTKWFSTDL